MTSNIRRLLLLLFVLLMVACDPPPRHAGSAARKDPNADARWLLSPDGGRCFATGGDLLAGEDKLEIADSGQGASGVPAPDNPKLLAVREPILKELLAYEKATEKSEKEKHAQGLRELFGSISTAAALPFVAMLETQDALAVTFRRVLKGDPLKDELLGLLDKKHNPQLAQSSPQSPAPAAQPSASSVTLPAVNLTDEASFDQLHKDVKEQIDALEAGVKRISGEDTGACKKKLEHDTVPALRDVLRTAKEGRDKAFSQPDAAEKAKGLKDAGADYLGLAYATQLSLLAVNFVIVADHANEAGLPHEALDVPYNAYVRDEGMLSLLQASLEGDAGKMTAALATGTARFSYHLQYLDKWIVSLNQGAALSGKVVKVADIAMIAISIYQVWKMPVVAGGGAPSPPTITGVLPGGVAVSAGVNVANLANSLEAIRRLVALGALDGALVGGLASLGGSPGATIAELQKPSLSVQAPPSIKQSPKAMEEWVKGLKTRDTPTTSPEGQYEVRVAGPKNYQVTGGGEDVSADGVREADNTLLEAKYVGNSKISPYITGSGIPPNVRQSILEQERGQFRRYAAVIADPKTPAAALEVIVNDAQAKPYFEALLKQFSIPGNVVVKP